MTIDWRFNVAMDLDKASRRAIISWGMFDWANSSFPTIITTFIFAAYFTRSVAADTIVGTAQWGYAIAFAGMIVAVLSPVLGAIADNEGRRKPWLGVLTLIVIISTYLLWFTKPSTAYVGWALTWVVIATIAFELAAVFYNAMLPDIAPRGYMGRVSGWAWGLGYAGGLMSLVVALFGFVEGGLTFFHLDTGAAEHIRITSPLVAVWFGVFAIPLFMYVPDKPSSGVGVKKAITLGLRDLKKTIRQLPQNQSMLRFLIARMIYIDGLNTAFAFGGIYAVGTFGMTLTEVIQFGIAMNVTAGIGAASFAWLDDYIGGKPTILISLLGMILSGFGLVIISSKLSFWILALFLGLFVGPIQAASRSLMARLSPKEIMTEMFGLYAFSGRITAFLGPLSFGLLTEYFHTQRAGMASVLVLLALGGLILLTVRAPKAA